MEEHDDPAQLTSLSSVCETVFCRFLRRSRPIGSATSFLRVLRLRTDGALSEVLRRFSAAAVKSSSSITTAVTNGLFMVQ